MECSTVNSLGCAAATRLTNPWAKARTSSASGPTRIGTNTCTPRLPEVFTKDSSSRDSRPSFTKNAARAASENFSDCGSRSKQTQSGRSEEHTSELQSHVNLVCRLLLEKK